MTLKHKRPAVSRTLLILGLFAGTLCTSLAGISPLAFAQEFTSYYYTLVRQHQRIDPNVPQDAVIFIGDSMIQGLAVAAVAERGVNYGISGDTTAGVLKRLSIYQSVSRASGIVVLVGVNDLGMGKGDTLVDNYREILASLPRDRKIVVSAILPIDEKVLRFPSGNSKIQEMNARLETLCGLFSQVSFTNPGPSLSGHGGNLRNEFHVGDGIHLNRAGYRVLIDALKTELHDSN